MAVSRRKAVLKAADALYLDPLHCESTISYKVIEGSRRTWATVQLADCNRKIEWYFERDQDGVKKIERVLETLEAFRTSLVTAFAERKKRPAVRRKRVAHA